jgi:hypothetical protein
LLALSDVAGYGKSLAAQLADFSGSELYLAHSSSGTDQISASFSKNQGNPFTDSPSGAGDDSYLAFQRKPIENHLGHLARPSSLQSNRAVSILNSDISGLLSSWTISLVFTLRSDLALHIITYQGEAEAEDNPGPWLRDYG